MYILSQVARQKHLYLVVEWFFGDILHGRE